MIHYPAMPIVTFSSQSLNVVERGNGPAVVLIHSFPHDHRVWESQAESLSSTYRVITADLPGFGQSPPMQSFSIEAAATLLIQMIEHLGLPRAVVGGISMGGYITLAMIKRRPRWLAGVILADTKAAADTAEAKQKRSDLIELVRAGGAAHVIRQMLPTQLAADAAEKRPAALERLRAIMNSQTPQALIAGTQALRDRSDYSDVLHTIDAPALLLFGRQDQITPADTAAQLAESLKQPTVALVEEAGHISTIDQPERVTNHLRSFLQTIPF